MLFVIVFDFTIVEFHHLFACFILYEGMPPLKLEQIMARALRAGKKPIMRTAELPPSTTVDAEPKMSLRSKNDLVHNSQDLNAILRGSSSIGDWVGALEIYNQQRQLSPTNIASIVCTCSTFGPTEIAERIALSESLRSAECLTLIVKGLTAAQSWHLALKVVQCAPEVPPPALLNCLEALNGGRRWEESLQLVQHFGQRNPLDSSAYALLLSVLENCGKAELSQKVLDGLQPQERDQIMASYAALITTWSEIRRKRK